MLFDVFVHNEIHMPCQALIFDKHKAILVLYKLQQQKCVLLKTADVLRNGRWKNLKFLF